MTRNDLRKPSIFDPPLIRKPFRKILHEPMFYILFTSVKVARTCKGRKLKEGMYEGIHDRKLKEHFLRHHMIF